MSLTQALDSLQRAYDREDGSDSLNTAVRKALRQQAAAERLQFRVGLKCFHSSLRSTDVQKQDSAGNIYISRQGRDPELADIAIAFQLDSHQGSDSFTSALRVFSQLASEDLICGATLMGCTSINGEAIGKQLWESSGPVSKDGPTTSSNPLLEQFSLLPNPAGFSFSALFEVCETHADVLSLQGSFVLTSKAQQHVEGGKEVKVSMRNSQRAPYLSVKGPEAEKVARATICEYSSYIAALFDNFD